MSAVETAWETILRDQEKKYLEKHELIKNRQCEYLEKEIKSLLWEFTRNRCLSSPTALHIWNSSKVYCHLLRNSYTPWTSLWLSVSYTEPKNSPAPAGRKSHIQELDSVARNSPLN